MRRSEIIGGDAGPGSPLALEFPNGFDDLALVNMQGFTEVSDAVGGVTLELGEVVPLPPSIANEQPLPPSVGPGLVDMGGALAIAFARSRSADSDFQRMGRQRQLLAAVGSQISATDALGAFSTVSGVVDDSIRTSLSAREFDQLLGRLGDNSAVRELVGLTPPLIQPGSPDYGQIQAIIDAVQLGLITWSSS
jgi:anionic cell wall polymer biosynthesis LytR-Cps2A-Psr (LCP) family protein